MTLERCQLAEIGAPHKVYERLRGGACNGITRFGVTDPNCDRFSLLSPSPASPFMTFK
jgi:hypothetical protein